MSADLRGTDAPIDRLTAEFISLLFFNFPPFVYRPSGPQLVVFSDNDKIEEVPPPQCEVARVEPVTHTKPANSARMDGKVHESIKAIDQVATYTIPSLATFRRYARAPPSMYKLFPLV